MTDKIHVYTVVGFKDLTWNKQQQIIERVMDSLRDNPVYTEKYVVADHEGDIDVEATEERLYQVAEVIAGSTWQEWGVELNG